MKKTIKTFGELKVGDKVYSLNYNEWGVLTEHIITKIERNDFRTIIIIKGYLKHQLIGDVNSDKADLELFALNKSTTGEVAPTKEGVKLFWIQKIESRIECLQNEINELNNRLELEYKSIDKITKI